MTYEELSMLNNLMTNISVAYINRDWEMLAISYQTAKIERQQLGLPPFIGGPNLEFLEEEEKKTPQKASAKKPTPIVLSGTNLVPEVYSTRDALELLEEDERQQLEAGLELHEWLKNT